MPIRKLSLGRIFSLPVQAEKPVIKPLPPPPGKPPHVDWIGVTDTFISTYYNAPDRSAGRQQGVFHPSAGLVPEIGHCLRSIVFDLLCAPRSSTRQSPQLAKILENGTNRHKGLNDMFSAMAREQHMGVVRFEHDLPTVHKHLPIAGEADGRITMASGHRYVVDFKTINKNNYDKLRGVSDRYLVQLNTYLGLLGEKVGYIIYECKDNQNWAGPMQNFRLDFNPSLYRQTEEFCTSILREYVGTGTIPEYDVQVCNAHITFCGYADVCQKHRNMAANSRYKGMNWDWRPDAVKKRHLKVIQ